ncbi:uncharacterized protein DEA37_0004861 [Paragonimus westermani]|uniref:ER membrane protein complex subunit 1 n=1 Tax=Paragonimus westermani TaxID=34504 RepID=A0A5J4NCG9_9TREM|nr:uncharacterized protein DEA37_0004861 [Paragonimus westermani]
MELELSKSDSRDHINAVVFTDSTGLLSFRLLVQTEDQAIQVLRQNGKLQWIREEALADIVAVELVDLPVSESQARMEEEFGHTHGNLVEMFVKRFRTQAAQLWAYLNDCIAALPHLFGTLLSSSTSIKTTPAFADEDNPSANFGATVPPRLHLSFGSKLFESEHNPSLTSSDEASLVVDRTELSRPTIVNDLLTRDNFNLHKMIVVVTAVGKVFGLESNEGRLVWEHLVPSATVLANGKLALFQQRNTAHFPLPPITTALFRSKITNLPILYSFNPITGVPLHQPPADVFSMQSDIQQAVLMPGSIGEETDYVRPILMLDRNLQVG